MNTQKGTDNCLYCGKQINQHDDIEAITCGLKYGLKYSTQV